MPLKSKSSKFSPNYYEIKKIYENTLFLENSFEFTKNKNFKFTKN